MNAHLLIRKSHRYLGIVIAIQFLFWTISGLFFSWNDLDSVHGDHFRKQPRALAASFKAVAPAAVLDQPELMQKADSIQSINLISAGGKPLYQIAYFSRAEDHAHEKHEGQLKYILADAETGRIRGMLSQDEAVALARDHVVAPARVRSATLLEATGKHHEYRERPLPAWAVSFEEPECTVYISAERGTFQTIRHDQWRAFDFLWMFHTMDYEGRDNFNNWLLKGFSVLGLITVFSGIALFVVSSQLYRKRR